MTKANRMSRVSCSTFLKGMKSYYYIKNFCFHIPEIYLGANSRL